ncbi:MAG: dihydroneopterin aldolase [Aequorivita sp.]
MGTIRLKNIKIYGFHGCLEEEGQIGSDYLVNLWVKADLTKASITDELHDTVNYVLLQKIVREEMAVRSKLLEHVAKRIINAILEKVGTIQEVKVSIAKRNPPIGGDVAEVSVEMRMRR